MTALSIYLVCWPFVHRDSIIVRIHHYPAVARLTSSLVFVLLLLMADSIAAAEPTADEGKAFQPSLGIHFAFDSNIYDTNANPTGSWINTLTPALLLSTAPAQQHFSLLYQGEYGYFFEDSADNYADHVLAGLAKFELSSRAELDLAAATEKQHWGRGSYQTDGLDPTSPLFPAEPDEFDRQRWAGKFRYGAEGNRGRLTLGVSGVQIDHTNNRGRTQFLDYETQSGSAGLSLLFNQRTAIVLDAVFTDVRYESTRPGEASLDSEDFRYLLGLTWEATAKTRGSIRVGIQKRRFDDPSRAKTSNPSWAVDVRWSPREDSHLDFLTSRVNEETPREGAFIDTTSYKVAWTHQWSGGWESIVSWTQRDAEYVDSVRDDDSKEIHLGLRYPQGRLLNWEAGYTRRSRDSSLSNLVYDGNMFRIGVNIGN